VKARIAVMGVGNTITREDISIVGSIGPKEVVEGIIRTMRITIIVVVVPGLLTKSTIMKRDRVIIVCLGLVITLSRIRLLNKMMILR
jgi:hypothetical protein